MALTTTFGTMTTITVELPYETSEDQAKADKLNEELAGVGWRTLRAGYDFGFYRFSDLDIKVQRPEPVAFQSNDLVKIFRTVTDGDIHWQGIVNLDRKRYHHGYQAGMKPREWVGMFYRELPARLERDGKTFFGALEPFAETGTEGEIWTLKEYGKNGYDALVYLQNGDKITAYDNVRDGEVEWDGRVQFGPKAPHKKGSWILMREARHMDTDKWLALSLQQRPVAVDRAP